jgi:type II secretion system protein D
LVPAGTEIVADRKGNRILVRGSAASQQIVQRAVGSLDKAQSTSAAPAASSGSQPLLKVYSCPPGRASTVAGALQDEFGRTSGVRIVPDERTSQVLVLAAPEVQALVAARLGEAAGQSGPVAIPEPARPPASAQAEPVRGSEYLQQLQLSHTTAGSLEASLASILGDRLIPAATQVPGTASYRLKLSDGGEVKFTVDRGANRLTYSGTGAGAGASFGQLIRALDSPEQAADRATRLIPLKTTRAADAKRTVDAIRITNAVQERLLPADRGPSAKGMPLAARMFQPGRRADEGAVAATGETASAPAPAAGSQPKATAPRAGAVPNVAGLGAQPRGEEGGGLIGPVQVELLEGLDVLVIRGNARDVRQVVEIIQQIEKLSVETEPAIEVQQLNHVDCTAMSTIVTQLYTQVFFPRQGAATILPLVKPNALLLVGRKENVQRVVSLVKLLDVPVSPDAQFQVFRLKHAPALTAQTMIEEFYADRTGPVVRVTSDVRSNALVVHASPRDLAEVAAMIARIDTPTSEAVNELRMFKLTNTLAADLAQTLSEAIQSQATNQGQTGGTRTGATSAARTARTAGAAGTAGLTTTDQRSSMLQFVTVDVQGQQRLSSGILTDVRITYDARANTVLVAAPAESMPLIEALVKQLDQPPAVRAEVKVFTVVNSDASALVTMLGEFFGQPTTGTSGASGTTGTPNYQSAAREGESSLVPLRFAADARTNSIIASGTASDLLVVEAMLMRLDATDVRNRLSTVYRLKNAPANDVATAINSFLRSELTAINIQTASGTLLSPFEQIEHQVVVVAEPVSNSLIVAATPRYFEEIKKLVEDLDKRPPMVMIQVLIAQVDLTNDDEFGVELGLQDGLLFNRGIPAGTGTALNPGFPFNSGTLGNQNSSTALSGANLVGPQGLTNLGLGRTNAKGFGGLVLSASSESVSVLIRALKSSGRVDILARPQIQTLDNQTAYINVGQSVPQIQGVSLTQYGQTNNITYTNTGIILGVTPRISPDGIVVMEIDASRSDVGPEAEGIPISVSTSGQILRAPRINQQLAQTTVSATDGQTVVLGGLINRQASETHRQVPYLGDVPVIGRLFRFDSKNVVKTELLIVMTPHVIRTNEDAEALKRVEAARMHWCLADVVELVGESGLRGRKDDWPDSETKVIYPDGDPRTLHGPSSLSPGPAPMPPSASPEAVPPPEATPFRPEPSGTSQGKTPPTPRGTSRNP